MSTESNVTPSPLGVDGSSVVIQTGLTSKTAAGKLTISFSPPFTTSFPPVVVATPFWKSGAVGAPETIEFVDNNGFQVNSPNAALDYFVSWIAVAGATEYYYYNADAEGKARVAKGRPAPDSPHA
jgi:hypothetical protein